MEDMHVTGPLNALIERRIALIREELRLWLEFLEYVKQNLPPD